MVEDTGSANGAGSSSPVPPIAPPAWTVRTALMLDVERRCIETVRDEMVRRGSGDLEQAGTADDALDMIGAASQPFDVILLAGGRMQLQSIHVLTMLLKQRSRSVVVAYVPGAAPSTTAWRSFLGVADWLDLKDSERWPRKLARAVADGASVNRILERGRVPWDIDPVVAKAIYAALPGEAFQAPTGV